ncbi:Hypothetical protein A7982_07405 [Minicystis rosea]|nr:Hypothetical protein A7982_07405 [Minicystis rosea]
MRSFAQALFALVILSPTIARAGDAEAEALTLRRKAQEDQRSGDRAGAKEKLARALEQCRGGGCSKAVLARLHRDMGILLIAQGEDEEGAREFARALAEHPTIDMDETFATPEVWRAWVKAVRASEPKPQPAPPAAEPKSPPVPAPGCKAEGDCPSGQTCHEGACVASAPKPTPRKASSGFWVGAAVQGDLVFMGGSDPCGRESQGAVSYSCFRSDREQYVGVPVPGEPAGFTVAYGTTRLALHVEHALGGQFTGAARFGFAFGGGPTPARGPAFFPLHAEVRVAYWFGRPLSPEPGLRGFVALSGGVAQVDAYRTVEVTECRLGSPSGCVPAANAQPGGANPDKQSLRAYKKAGQGFAGLGLGLYYGFVEGSGAVLELRATQLFPGMATTLSPSLSYVVHVP